MTPVIYDTKDSLTLKCKICDLIAVPVLPAKHFPFLSKKKGFLSSTHGAQSQGFPHVREKNKSATVKSTLLCVKLSDLSDGWKWLFRSSISWHNKSVIKAHPLLYFIKNT